MHITSLANSGPRNALGELTPPASAGTGASLFDFGSQIVNAITAGYIANKTGQAPANTYPPASVTVTSGTQPNWPKIIMVGSLGLLGVAVAMKVMRKGRR